MQERFDGITIGIVLPCTVAISDQTARDEEIVKKRFKNLTFDVTLPNSVDIPENII